MLNVTYYLLKTNGDFSLVTDIFDKEQHPNQQCGLDKYVSVLDHSTWNINTVKLYENSKGLYFKKNGTHYLDEFTDEHYWIPAQLVAKNDLKNR